MSNMGNVLPTKKLLSISALSRKYDKSRPTVYKILQDHLLSTIWEGRRLKIDCSDPQVVLDALHSLPGVGHYDGRHANYKPVKAQDARDVEFDLRFELFEKKQEELRLKRKLARLKKSKL